MLCSIYLYRVVQNSEEKNGSAVSNGNSSGHIHFTGKELKQYFIIWILSFDLKKVSKNSFENQVFFLPKGGAFHADFLDKNSSNFPYASHSI